MALDNFVLEVNKIVSAPYLVSLKGLHNILHDCGDEFAASLHNWAYLKRDQIPALASAVVQGLGQWPYVVDIVERLCCVSCIRDALLDASPSLLSQFLDKAIETDSSFDQYAPVCLELLREPLPTDVSLPSSAQALLWKFFGKAVGNPCARTAEPVYLLLDGACHELLGILPEDGLEALRGQLTKIMRQAKGVEEQLLSLLCLAVISKTKLLRASHTVSRSNSVDPTLLQPTVPSAPNEAERFFVGDRALKTMHLISLQVIYACRAENTTAETQRLKLVTLAREILAAIDQEHRENWVKTNSSIFRKLQEKVTHEQLPMRLQLESLSFVSMLLTDSDNLPKGMVDSFQRAFGKLSEFKGFDRHLTSVVTTTLSFFSPHLDEDFWRNFFQVYLSRLSSTDKKVSPCDQWLLNSLSALESLCSGNPNARRTIVQVASTSDIAKVMERVDSEKDGVLVRELCASLLRATAYIRAEEPAIDISLTVKLVTRLQHTSERKKLQLETLVLPQVAPIRPLAEQSCTPDDRGASHQWRERLSCELRSEMTHRQDAIIRIVGDVCRDLERRCEHVEAPLRAKQAEYDRLNDDFDKLESRISRFQVDAAELEKEIAILKAAKSNAEVETASVASELTSLNGRYQELAVLHQRTKDEAEENIRDTRRQFEIEKLDLQAKIACHVEKTDKDELEINNLRECLDKTEAEVRREKKFSEEVQKSLDTALSELRASAERENLQKVEANQSLEESRQCQTALESRIKTLEAENREISTRLEKSDTANGNAQQAYERDLTSLRTEHEQAILNQQSNAASEKQLYEGSLRDAKAELARTQELHNDWMRQKEHEIQELQTRVKTYADESREKTNLLEEAHQMKSRLLSALGLTDATLDPAGKQSNVSTNQKAIKSARDKASRVLPSLNRPEKILSETEEPGLETFKGLGAGLTPEIGSPVRGAKLRTTSRASRRASLREPKNARFSYSSAWPRRSIDAGALADGDSNVVNVKRRQSMGSKGAEAANYVGSSARSEYDDVAEDQTLIEVTPDDQENTNKRLYSTGDTQYGALAPDDFDASTVEL